MNYLNVNLKLFLIFIVIFSYFFKAIFGLEYWLYLGVFFGFILFLEEVVAKTVPIILAYYIIIVFLGAALLLFNNPIHEGKAYLPIMLSSIGVALSIYRTIHTQMKFHLRLSAILFFGFTTYVLAYFFMTGMVDDAVYSSRNHISVNLIMVFAYYVLARKFNNVNISLLIPMLVVFISVISVSTAAIVTSIIIFIGFLASRGAYYIILSSCIIAMLILSIDLVALLNSIDDDLLIKINDKINNEDIRFEVIRSYMNNIDVYKFIIGVPLSETVWSFLHGNNIISSSNLHNSYLLLHAKLGILSFFVLFGIFLSSFKLFKKDTVVFFLFLAILARAFTDTIAFSHGYHEWSILLIVLYAFDKKKGVTIER
jgi:hypothetical protein